MHFTRLTSLLAAALVALIACAGCEPADSGYTGTVIVDEVTLAMPALPLPRVALDEGPDGVAAATVRVVSATTSLGTRSHVESVTVRAGDRVEAGQIVAIVSPALFDAEIRSRQAAADAARAQLGVIETRLDDVADNRAEVADTRAEVRATITELTGTRADLAAKLAEARRALAAIEAMLPPGGSLPPTMTPPPGMPNPAELRAAIARLEAGIAQIDAGLAKARAGLGTLDSARAKLSDAEDALDSARTLATSGVAALDAATDVARAVRELCIVRASSAGTVVWAVPAGTVLAPGAPVATVREDAAVRVRTWLPLDVADDVSIGDRAVVTADSVPGSHEARVTFIGSHAEFPPNTLATREIHMTRAVRVEITLDEGAALPPGTPADLIITTE